MEWGIIITGVTLVGMMGLLVQAVGGAAERPATSLPDYEPEYETLAINVADYQFAM